MTPFLRGSIDTLPPTELCRLKHFLSEGFELSDIDKKTFMSAVSAQGNNEYSTAKDLYEMLLIRYPQSKAIKHNLTLI